MQTIIKESSLKLALFEEAYLQKKLAAVEKMIDPADTLASAEIEVERTTRHHRQGKIFRAEINLQTALGKFRVEAYGDSVSTALDYMKDEIQVELARKKDKIIMQTRAGGRRAKDLLHKR